MSKQKTIQTVIGYLRVSTDEQGQNGHGIDAQRAAIEAECSRRGWTLELVKDIASGKNGDREGLDYALACLARGEADALIVSKLDRLSRSVADFAGLVERAEREHWTLVVLDPALDLSTPAGRMLAHILSALSQWEREMIGQRTREGLAAAKANGKRLGRPQESRMPADVERRILREHREGRSLRQIAGGLNEDGTPTTLGGKAWYAATIRNVVRRLEHR
jgi:DNA invertase Pin-like site-specific DNA recombinase